MIIQQNRIQKKTNEKEEKNLIYLLQMINNNKYKGRAVSVTIINFYHGNLKLRKQKNNNNKN